MQQPQHEINGTCRRDARRSWRHMHRCWRRSLSLLHRVLRLPEHTGVLWLCVARWHQGGPAAAASVGNCARDALLHEHAVIQLCDRRQDRGRAGSVVFCHLFTAGHYHREPQDEQPLLCHFWLAVLRCALSC